MLRGAARGLRRPAGAWRSPVEGESVYSLVLDSAGDDHGQGDTSLLQAESGMREVRPPSGFLDAAAGSSLHAQTSDPFAPETPDLISLHDAIWLPSSSRLSIPALLGRPSGTPSPTPSSLLNPPPSSSTAAGALPAPTMPMPHGLRESITQSLETLPSVAHSAEPATVTRPAPAPSEEPSAPQGQGAGLLRPSLTAHDSARTFDDREDYSSRLVGMPVPHRAGSGDTLNSDTASSKAGSEGSEVR
ncbi:hypothetical protein B0H16DRAFT_1563464 [Mycena metata]|uniref:Uncharacterized protein n=1 Tax=Mycena metata TaxID=1033252 RepID=A0AAD7N251_9AGAR|nr:hypothetical protein B0H16DRAFT_1563464 [Mycena metata]